MTGKRFTYLNTNGWNKDGFLNTMNGLNEKNKKLQKENEQLKQQIKQLQHWNKCLAEKRHQELKGDVE